MESKVIARRALAMRVLAVAVEGNMGDWAAYIDSVPGNDHAAEEQSVAKRGSKLNETVAMSLFPALDAELYRR